MRDFSLIAGVKPEDLANPLPPVPATALVRPSWDAYFIGMAKLAAKRGTCDRKQVGAVLVRDNHVLATGYNGAPSGTDNCIEAGHQLVKFHDGGESCVRTIHAEQNAILQCAFHGVAALNSTIYTTASPCWECLKALIQVGTKRIVFDEEYNSARSKGIDIPAIARAFGIIWDHHGK